MIVSPPKHYNMELCSSIISAIDYQNTEIQNLKAEILSLINYVAHQQQKMIFVFNDEAIEIMAYTGMSRYLSSRIIISGLDYSHEHCKIIEAIFKIDNDDIFDDSLDSLRKTIAGNNFVAYDTLKAFTMIVRSLRMAALDHEKERLTQLSAAVIQESFDCLYNLFASNADIIVDGNRLVNQLEAVIGIVPDDLPMLIDYASQDGSATIKKILMTRISQLMSETDQWIFRTV